MSKSLFYQGQPGTSSAVAVAGSKSVRTIDQAAVVNPTGSADTLSVWLVQDGDTAADDTKIYHDLAVSAGGTVTLAALINQALPADAEIHLAAATGATLTVTISGR